MTTRAATDSDAARRRTFLAGFALLFALGIGIAFYLTRPRPTVEARIAEAFDIARVAAQKGDISGAVSVVSSDFKVGSVTKKRLRLLLFQARQQAQGTDWRVEVAPPRVLPVAEGKPDERLVITRIVARGAGGETVWSTGDSPVTLLMRREPTKIWGVFPGDAWRVVGAPGLPSVAF